MEMWNNSPDGHLRDNFTERVKFIGALFLVQKPIHIRIPNKLKERFARSDFFYPGRTQFISLCKDIDHSKGPPLRLKDSHCSVQGQKALFPGRRKSRQRVRRAKQIAHRVRPQADSRVGRLDVKRVLLPHKRRYVVAQNGEASHCEGGRRSGLAGFAVAAQDHRVLRKTYCACMQRADSPSLQQKSTNRPAQINGEIFHCEQV
jgi:hypothetical protein